MLVSLGKFNCVSGDVTCFVASDAGEKRRVLTGVTSLLADLKGLVLATHLQEDFPVEVKKKV